MEHRRHMETVGGTPERVASRMAARLAYLGDTVEARSETAFTWRGPAAERWLFRCPAWVDVEVLPGDGPGRSIVTLEWRDGPAKGWLRALGVALAGTGIAAAFLAPAGWPLWKLAFGLWPLLAAIVGLPLMDSGWRSKIAGTSRPSGSGAFDAVPEAERFLTLSESERRDTLELLAMFDQDQREKKGLNLYGGADRRSTVEFGGWPVWHVAFGRDAVTDEGRTARGWYARGQVSQGFFALGQKAHGWLAVGQMAVGLVAVGQLAIGVVAAVGQLAVSGLFTLGQLALGLVAVGQLGLGLFVAGMLFSDAVGLVALKWMAMIVPALALVTATSARMALTGAEQRGLAARLRAAREAGEIPEADESSLSRAERMTGDDATRGISVAE